jgi:hypothetical protein
MDVNTKETGNCGKPEDSGNPFQVAAAYFKAKYIISYIQAAGRWHSAEV